MVRKYWYIMRRNKRSVKPSNPGGKSTRDHDHIPQNRMNGIHKRTTRYVVTAASAINIDHKDLLMSGGGIITVVNSTLTAIFAAARIRRVRVWAPVSTTAAPVAGLTTSLCLLWGGSSSTGPGSTQMLITDTTLSSVHPAYIDTKPPKGSQADWWGNSDTVENLVQIFAYTSTGGTTGPPVGTVIEMDVEFAFNFLSATPVTLGVAAGALGVTYYPTLDNSGTKIAYPVGLLSTI